jgi:hypothetical protein
MIIMIIMIIIIIYYIILFLLCMRSFAESKHVSGRTTSTFMWGA